MGRERVLAEALEPVSDPYDIILIDCPPSLGLLTVNALVAARKVLAAAPASGPACGLALATAIAFCAVSTPESVCHGRREEDQRLL